MYLLFCNILLMFLITKVRQKRNQELRRVQKRKKAIEGKREKRRKRKRGKRRGFTPWSRSSTSKALLPGRLSTLRNTANVITS
jgi:ribosome assembly protein YihI (activator of Der GTPase)